MKLLTILYSILGFATGFVLLLLFLTSLPDGKLHAVFCNVGQGDALYLRLPDGRDIVIDGGPDEKVISCLSRHMPFWDRSIDLMFLTHAERDHVGGLIAIADRYSVGTMVMSSAPVINEENKELLAILEKNHVPIQRVTAGTVVAVGNVSMTVLWPSEAYLAHLLPSAASETASVLGVTTNPNQGSLVMRVRYGSFSLLLTGDADTSVESAYQHADPLATKPVTVLKVPHHGSKTGISESFVKALQPSLAIISVGKNTYGHPAPNILRVLADNAVQVLRTDQQGDILIMSDGREWQAQTSK